MAVRKWAGHTCNKAFDAHGALQLKKTSEIQYNIVCMAWLLGDGGWSSYADDKILLYISL